MDYREEGQWSDYAACGDSQIIRCLNTAGSIKRNRQHLTAIPESHSNHDITNMPEQAIAVQPPRTDIQTTRSGRLSVPPHRLISDPDWNT